MLSGPQLQGFGVIGDSAEGPQEVEGEPALSLTLGVLPGVSIFTHITATTANLDLRTHLVHALQSFIHVHTWAGLSAHSTMICQV